MLDLDNTKNYPKSEFFFVTGEVFPLEQKFDIYFFLAKLEMWRT